jgi:N-acetylglucosaminyl-diphospho-decaprenol L-rhamnosyltransferase
MASVGAAERVSVVIVSYNTKDLTRRCVESIDPECEVIVVDNASTDGSLEMLRVLPRVKLIENSENLGFGAANNGGIAAASRPLILLLNSDAAATPGAISFLSSLFDAAEVVAAGGMLMNADGSLQESSANRLTLWAVFCEQLWLEKLFRSSFFFSPYWMSRRLAAKGSGPHEVAQVMGACLMFRPLEIFDERFFLYCEDTELCARLTRHGKILYAPAAKFYHDLGSSSASMRWKAVAYYNCGKELYFRIHRGRFAALVCLVLDRLGALLRFLIWLLATMAYLGVHRSFKEKAEGFWKVLLAPTSYSRLRKRG